MEENRNSAISVRNVCIDYKSLKTGSIKENLFKIKKVEQEIFHAVRNVSFEVPEGQILGITGKNGSGKSTMLRAIAGIFSADSGEIDLHGHTISLLSIGVGFKNELSGRENIILSGMLLGFSRHNAYSFLHPPKQPQVCHCPAAYLSHRVHMEAPEYS